jgi:hypothetical protein
VQARALRDVVLAVTLLGAGCAVQPSRTYYDDLDAGADVEHRHVGGGDASVPDDAAPPSDDGPEVVDATEAAPPMESGVADSEAGEEAAAPEASADVAAEAAPEAGPDAPVEAGCGPTNTTSNCGGCGNACGNEHVMTASCTGSACAYTCQTGYANCAETPPNTTGCECATPACCGTSCQTIHEAGYQNGSYYDCNPIATTSSSAQALENQAIAACSKALGVTCNPGFGCGTRGPFHYACNGDPSTGNGCTYCWSYAGTDVLQFEDCGCPPMMLGNWD